MPKQPNVDIQVCDKPLTGSKLAQMTYRNKAENYDLNILCRELQTEHSFAIN
jgi:hypothetical protein